MDRRHISSIPVAALFILCLSITGCSLFFKPKPRSSSIWKHIKKSDPYVEYAFMPGKEGLYKPVNPHGYWMQTFINEEALESIEDKRKTFKDGSIIVSEKHSKEKELSYILVMFKDKGYNSKSGDWFWEQFDITGEPRQEAKEVKSISCHSDRVDEAFGLIYTLEFTHCV